RIYVIERSGESGRSGFPSAGALPRFDGLRQLGFRRLPVALETVAEMRVRGLEGAHRVTRRERIDDGPMLGVRDRQRAGADKSPIDVRAIEVDVQVAHEAAIDLCQAPVAAQ